MRTIQSLNSTERPKQLEISVLVVANACIDNTTSVLKNFCSEQNDSSINLPLQFVEEPVIGKSHALNCALKLVTEGYICFIDDDHRVDSQYFRAVYVAITQSPDIAIFCGQIIPDWTGQEPEWIHDTGKYKIYPLPIPHFELGTSPLRIGYHTKLPGGGNLIIHRNVFEELGEFSVALGPKGHDLSGSEDSEFILRALEKQIPIQYDPIIIQYHYVDHERLKLSYLIRKSYQRTRSLTQAKHPTNTAVPRYLWRKLFEYIVNACFAFEPQKRRFFLMRVASTGGEITGLRER